MLTKGARGLRVAHDLEGRFRVWGLEGLELRIQSLRFQGLGLELKLYAWGFSV